jgi:tRNA dimethylallyltransferase
VTTPPLVILGPTATGKSALAMAVAEARGGEIVNADALQVYRGFDIGTAKPSPADRARVPHHLLDVLPPDEPLSAGQFATLARAAVADVRSRGRLPILVGGSGLYLRAVLAGIADIPPVDRRLRAWLAARSARHGLPALRRWLAAVDPATAARTSGGDTQRTLRALEVALGTGRRQSDWIAAQPPSAGPLAAVRVGLTLPRAVLYDRIAGRVHAMLASGWVREVGNLLKAGLDPGLPAFQAIGYRQLAQHLRGEIGLDQAVEETIRATRRYAKRQLTWFRREPDVTWLAAESLPADSSRALASVLDLLSSRDSGRDHGEARDQHPGRIPLPEPQGGARDAGGSGDR